MLSDFNFDMTEIPIGCQIFFCYFCLQIKPNVDVSDEIPFGIISFPNFFKQFGFFPRKRPICDSDIS
jgi:hypothetical protein